MAEARELLQLAHAKTISAQKDEAFLRSQVRSLQSDHDDQKTSAASESSDSSEEEVCLFLHFLLW